MISILGFGDSLTAGTPGYEPSYDWGDEKSQYGYWMIQEAKNSGYHDLVFRNEGVPGELAQWMPRRLSTLLDANSFDIIVVMGGSNDLGWGRPISSIIGSLNTLWDLCNQHGSKVVACTLPPIAVNYPGIQEGQSEINDFILRNSSSEKFQTVDTFSVLASNERLLLPEFDSGDGLHLSIDGYRAMGIEIWTSGVSRFFVNT